MTPDDPRHGTRAGYLAHRKHHQDPCDPCRQAHTRHCKQYRHATHNGATQQRVPASAVIELLDRANAAGVADHAIAAITGLSTSGLCRIRAFRRHANVSTYDRVRSALEDLTLRPNALVDVNLTRERVKSLMAQGYQRDWIVAQTGWVIPSNWLKLKRVRYRSAVAVRDLVQRVGDRRGPSKTTATWAAKAGWQVLAAWDDPQTVTWPVGWFDQIEEEPAEEESSIDVSRIERRILGDRTFRLHKGEAEEIVRRLQAEGWSLRRIAMHTGLKPERYVHGAAA